MRSIAVFRWKGELPSYESERDPERLTLETARSPAIQILAGVRKRNSADRELYDGEGGWHFSLELGGTRYGIFVHWTGIGDVDDCFAAQIREEQGCLRALLGRRPDASRLEPACRLLAEVFAEIPEIDDLRWVSFAEFKTLY